VEDGLITHRRVFEHYHRVVLKRFPYALYYRLDGGKAVIAGVLFLKQDPRSIERALKERL